METTALCNHTYYTYHSGNSPADSMWNIKHQKAEVAEGTECRENPDDYHERVPGTAPPTVTRHLLLNLFKPN